MTQRETATPTAAGGIAQAVASIKDNIEKVLVGKGGVIELTLFSAVATF